MSDRADLETRLQAGDLPGQGKLIWTGWDCQTSQLVWGQVTGYTEKQSRGEISDW